MPIPSGGLTTYGFEPRAVLVAGKALRETEPGTYTATVRLTERGEYDLVFLLDEPRVTECFPLPVNANPAIRKSRVAVDIKPLDARPALRVGENVLRVRVTDLFTREAREGLTDLRVILAAPGGWRQRAAARPVGDGVYELTLTAPTAGVYYLSFEAASIALQLNDRPPVILRASGR
jgi:hypothetical protein